VATTAVSTERVRFQTHPDRYRHWKLSFAGDTATLAMTVRQGEPQRPGYELKLNSYDIGVDVELADAIQRCASSTRRCAAASSRARSTASSARARTS
jgi:benzoyl-CoA-dihydrodiol lyase